jgi:hypothetical protein
MRKTIVYALVFALVAIIALPLVADDGSVLPADVFRLRLIPAYEWIPGSYDNSGSYTGYSTTTTPDGTISVPNMGFALEYGINDWITAGLQWAPGITFDSNFPMVAGPKANVDGLSALFAGLMVQIVGPKAPVVSNVIRFAVAPGVKIPFGGADFATQYANSLSNSAYTVENPDLQTLGIGGRAWLDYVVNSNFFLDLYTQFIDYPGTVGLKDSSYLGYAWYGGLGGFNPQVNYGYTLRFELDPHYNVDIANGINLAINCAFRYDGTPAQTWSQASPAPSVASPSPSSAFYSANPSVDFFFYKAVVPFELDLDYGQPLAGTNTTQAYSLDVQIKAYLKFW